MDLVVNPPRPGEPSYESWLAQKDGTLASLARRAKLVADTLNSIEGFTCNVVQGAMYAFPQIHLPQKVVSKQEKKAIVTVPLGHSSCTGGRSGTRCFLCIQLAGVHWHLCDPWLRLWSATWYLPLQNNHPATGGYTVAWSHVTCNLAGGNDKGHAWKDQRIPLEVFEAIFINLWCISYILFTILPIHILSLVVWFSIQNNLLDDSLKSMLCTSYFKKCSEIKTIH